jgi:CHAD domain-containing protein
MDLVVEIRDSVRQRLDKAVRALEKRNAPSDGAVHYARKQLKRARAGLRLLRDAVPKASYSRENGALRDAARPLSLIRDARIMLDTLERARRNTPSRGGGLRRLRRALREERASVRREILQHAVHRKRIVRTLTRAGHRLARWRPRVDNRSALRASVKRLYRRGRKALARAETDPTVENLHEFRKQVKYLGLAMQTLAAIEASTRGKLAKRAEFIADRLGDDHDLAMLREKITALSPAMGKVPKALLTHMDRRRRKLEKKAVKRGQRLYECKPKDFVADSL